MSGEPTAVLSTALGPSGCSERPLLSDGDTAARQPRNTSWEPKWSRFYSHTSHRQEHLQPGSSAHSGLSRPPLWVPFWVQRRSPLEAMPWEKLLKKESWPVLNSEGPS